VLYAYVDDSISTIRLLHAFGACFRVTVKHCAQLLPSSSSLGNAIEPSTDKILV
jgi:hypothetical protein